MISEICCSHMPWPALRISTVLQSYIVNCSCFISTISDISTMQWICLHALSIFVQAHCFLTKSTVQTIELLSTVTPVCSIFVLITTVLSDCTQVLTLCQTSMISKRLGFWVKQQIIFFKQTIQLRYKKTIGASVYSRAI